LLDDVYNRKILELAGNIPRIGRLERAHASATAHARLCGSTVTVDVAVEGDRITDFGHVVRACALGQASSSVMARNVVGASVAEVREARAALAAMLRGEDADFGERFADLKYLEPVKDYPARHASTMLTFDAVCEAIDTIEAGRSKVERGEAEAAE